MQFSVPQFTDVEDKIVGSLTIKQFGIVFAAAAFLFIIYTLTQNTVLVVIIGIPIGLAAIMLAFFKINGRPVYTLFGPLTTFFLGNKVYVFQKDGKVYSGMKSQVVVNKDEAAQKNEKEMKPKQSLKQVGFMLGQKKEEQEKIIENLKNKNW